MLLCKVYGRTACYDYKLKPNSKTIIGIFDLIDYGSHYEIWSLRIHDRYHNKGYGTQMLREFLAEFKHDKPLTLYVYKTNAVAIHLYEKVGFVICGEYPYGDYAWEMKYDGESITP